MRMLRIAALALVYPACGPAAVTTRPAGEDQATLVVYAAAAAASAVTGGRLAELRAVRADGTSVRLPLRARDPGARELRVELLLAWSVVAPGSYAAIELVPAASEDPATTSAPLRADGTFQAERGRATLLVLRQAAGGALWAEIPPRPPAGVLGLALSRDAGAVTLFDKQTSQVVAVVPVGYEPAGLAVDPLRRRAYVALAGDDSIAVLDLEPPRVIDRVRLGGGSAPADAVLIPDASRLVVPNRRANSLSLLDAQTLVELDRVAVGDGPVSLVVDAEGSRAYVFNSLGGSVSVVDLRRAELVATVAVEAGPLRGQLDPTGRVLYVVHADSPNLLLLDTASLNVTSRVYVGSGATDVLVDPRTRRIHVARRGAAGVEVYDPSSLLPVDELRAPSDVAHMALDPEENALWLALPRRDALLAVRLGGVPVAELDVAGRPERVALMVRR